MRFIHFLLPALILIYTLPSRADLFLNENHRIGLAIDSWRYEEPGLMEDFGGLFGVEYEFKMNPQEFLFYQFNAELLAGRTRYNGQDLSSGTPLEFDQTNAMLMLQGYIGVPIELSTNSYHIIPKIGLLLRTLTDFDDDFGGDYQRDQRYLVIPIGFDFITRLENDHKITLSAWISAYFQGLNKTYLTDVGGTEDLEFKQDKGSGAEISLSYSNDQYYGSLVYRTWNVEDSERKPALVPQLSNSPLQFYEPKNQTTSIGIRFGVLF